jgi:uncharacterized phiE125 gp8 family phage protein
MNFTGPWSDYYPDGFPGMAYQADGKPVSMRKLTTSKGFPIAITDLLLDLRVDSDDEEKTVMRMARAAAAFLEKRTAISVLQGTYEAKFTSWNFWKPWEFQRSPLRVVKSISWFDRTSSPPDWVSLPLEQFFVDEREKSFFIYPHQGVILPGALLPWNGIRVLFNAGYDIELLSGDVQESGEGMDSDDDAELPIADDMRTTLTMLTAHFYENRELFAADKLTQVEASAGSLLASNRQFW